MSVLLRRLPPLGSFGVGSLPHTSPAAAARHARRAYAVPFCPQLPQLEPDMVGEWLGSATRCSWAPDRDRELPVAWRDFHRAVRAAPPAHGVVKLQVTGPLTLATALERSAGRTGDWAEVLPLATQIAAWLAANTAAQVQSLRYSELDVLLVVDEPGAGMLGLGADAASAWDPLRAVAPAWGLHICGPVPWSLVQAAAPDLISFDLTRQALDQRALEALATLMRRGSAAGLGVVDAPQPDGVPAATARITGALERLAPACGWSPAQVAESVLVSPTCGTGRLPLAAELLAAAELTAAALEAAGAVGAGSSRRG